MLRWRIGDVTITSVAEIETPTTPRFLFRGLDKQGLLAIAAEKPWLKGHFVSPEGYLLQKVQALVVDTGSRRIVVDTCVGNDKARSNPGWDHLQLPFLEDLEAAGYPAASIDTVVCTHLHVDHVGWNTRLVDGRWVPTFPNARYLFVRPEYDHWSVAPDLMGDDVMGDSVQPIVDAGLADLVPPDHRVCEEVRFEPTPGHTPAHISVVIASGGQRAVITGDLMHTPVQMAVPSLSSSVDFDPDQARETRMAFLQRHADGTTLVIGTHFGTPTAGLVHDDGDGTWRFEV
jgi:glyoxylase-like metal-dependent hydrolase (beta-lactamase superfamily II)